MTAQRELVSITRTEIDAQTIQGFVLASSDQLVVLQYVCDFRLDGLMVLSTSDITEIRSSATNKFQTTLLEQDGLLEQVPFDMTFDLQDWRAIIKQLARAHPLLILECEHGDDPDFIIGRLVKTTSAAAHVRYFTGVGRWLEKPDRVNFCDITCCQVDSNYLNVYQRHLSATPPTTATALSTASAHPGAARTRGG